MHGDFINYCLIICISVLCYNVIQIKQISSKKLYVINCKNIIHLSLYLILIPNHSSL